MKTKYRLISLFSGAGGFDLGFETSGRWETVVANDSHPAMCETLRINRGIALGGHKFLDNTEIIEGDIQGVHESISGYRDVDLVLGGPPCQSFSAMGNHGGYSDDRGNLIFDFAKVVENAQPTFFLFENVPNMKTGKWKLHFQEYLEYLRFQGAYSVASFLLCCADYGAATIRKRVFIVGTRSELKIKMSPPPAINQEPGRGTLLSKLPNWKTVAEAFQGLPPPVSYFDQPFLHFAPQHDQDTIERFKKLAFGETDPKRKRDRLDPGKPSLTLMSGGEAGGTRAHIHPFEPREITPREAARLHGFPDNYTFSGNKSQIAIQISNSVPVPMGLAWANHLAGSLDALSSGTYSIFQQSDA